MKLLIINGPSLNLIGFREVEVYGKKTYLDLVSFVKDIGKENKVKIKMVQTNSEGERGRRFSCVGAEGEIIDLLQDALLKDFDGIILNAGAYTHYSYAIRDAVVAIKMDVVEVHLSDINNREDFRKISVLKDVCKETFMGKGFESYKEAIMYFVAKNRM